MWKTGLAAAAVGIATLVGVFVFGRQLVEPEAAPEPPPAAAPRRNWGERASDRCDEALANVRAELAACERLATRMRTLFGALDAEGCVRYPDPASYG